jgi:hypothetical protein
LIKRLLGRRRCQSQSEAGENRYAEPGHCHAKTVPQCLHRFFPPRIFPVRQLIKTTSTKIRSEFPMLSHRVQDEDAASRVVERTPGMGDPVVF